MVGSIEFSARESETIHMKTVTRLFFLLSLTRPALALADGLFRADFGYMLDDTQSNGSDTKTTRQLIDLTGGYIFQPGWVLTAQYAMEKVDATNSGTTTESNRTSYGPGGGWVSRQNVGPYVTGTFYFASNWVTPGATYQGWGYQLDVGMKVDIQKIFLVGGLSYEYFEYAKTSTGTVSPSLKQSHIDPRIGLQIEF